MSITVQVIVLIFGLILGMIIPRIPLLLFTRFLGLERGLSPHPDPIKVDVPLIQRMLLMRRVHMMCWILALFPLCFSILIMNASPEPFALGLFAGVIWFAISRVVPLNLDSGFGIMPMSLVREVNNLRQPNPPCCDRPIPQWEVRSIRCKYCRKLILNTPRPDLGRIRTDGRLMGTLRILLMDGRSPYDSEEEE